MDDAEKFFHTKRLLKKRAAALRPQEIRFLGVGSRCRENHMARQLRTVLANPVVEIAAREITCDFQVGHYQVQRLALEHPERLAALSKRGDGSKAFSQDFTFQLQDRFFLVNQQNTALSPQPLPLNHGLLLVAPDRRQGQQNRETGAAWRDIAN